MVRAASAVLLPAPLLLGSGFLNARAAPTSPRPATRVSQSARGAPVQPGLPGVRDPWHSWPKIDGDPGCTERLCALTAGSRPGGKKARGEVPEDPDAYEPRCSAL
nr:uncharacterized protein LOC105728904 [Aotus nancymaae]